jgi:aldehyde dehydrogenase (NAD+)
VTEQVVVGDPADAGTQVGPVVSEVQYDRIQKLIQAGIDEGAKLVIGGTGRPDGPGDGILREADGVLRRSATT